jgi:hypothetical protein
LNTSSGGVAAGVVEYRKTRILPFLIQMTLVLPRHLSAGEWPESFEKLLLKEISFRENGQIQAILSKM